MIAQATIENAKSHILDVISRHVNLKKVNGNYVGLCPFHTEKTPSFNVSPSKGIFKCFGCGESGDAIQFVRRIQNKAFNEAVEVITAISGLAVEHVAYEAKKQQQQPKKEICSLPLASVPVSTCQIDQNPLTKSLRSFFWSEIIQEVLQDYGIAIHLNSIDYPEADELGRFRTGKCIYLNADGSRAEKFEWIHPPGFAFTQCLTGLHLIEKGKKIAIVEGQSTMLFMACLTRAVEMLDIHELDIFRNCIWLSTGGFTNLNLSSEDVYAPLKGHSVTLYPDAGFYTKWKQHADQMEGVNVITSDFMETYFNHNSVSRNEDLRDLFMIHLKDDLLQLLDKYDAVAALQKWMAENPAGGIFEFNGKKYNVQKQQTV